MTSSTAMSENEKLTTEKSTFSTGKIQRLMRTFLSSDAASMIERMPWLVESLMSVKVTFPNMM